MKMETLRDLPDMSYGGSNNGCSYFGSPVLSEFTVLNLNISKRIMLFPKIFISVHEAKDSDVRKSTAT